MSRAGLWLGVLLGVPFSAHAFDLSPDTTRYLGDPAFLPLTGQVFGSTGYQYRELSTDFVPSGAHSSTGASVFAEQLGYGISDRFSINLDTGHADIHTKYTYTSPRSYTTDYYDHGFVDPSFGATWRAIEQEDAPVSVDLVGAYSPSLFAARVATPSMGGTVATGGPSEGLTLDVSREMRSLTVQAYAVTTFYDLAQQKMLSDDSSRKVGPYWVYGFGLRGQGRLTDRIYLNAGAGYSGQTPNRLSDPVENLAQKYFYGSTVNAYVAPGYHLIPNRLVLSAEYDRYYLGSQTISIGSGPLGTWKHYTEDIYTVGVRFLFF
jgi:hypothetical protein